MLALATCYCNDIYREAEDSESAELIVGISRLVPRKGFDVAIRAVSS